MNNSLQTTDDSADWEDPVFDTLLVESLGGPEPPDLTQQILAALATVASSTASGIAAGSGRAVEPPPVQSEPPLQGEHLRDGVIKAASTFEVSVSGADHRRAANQANMGRVSGASGSARSESFRGPLSVLIGLASLAASIAIAFWMFPGGYSGSADSNVVVADGSAETVVGGVGQGKSDGSPASDKMASSASVSSERQADDPTTTDPTTTDPTTTENETSGSGRSRARTEPIQLGGSNFAGSPDAEFGNGGVGVGSPSGFEPSFPEADKPLAGAEIVRLINTKLMQAWDASEIQASGNVDSETLVGRVNNLLGVDAIGAKDFQATNASGVGRINNGQIPLETWLEAVEKGLKDAGAQERLASRLAGSLLGRTGVRRINREQFVNFVSFLQPTLSGEKRYDAAVTELLGARGSVEPKSKSFNPAAVWMGALAGPQSVALAEQAGHALLDVDLKCGRCHDHPLDGRVWQDQYWQFSAMFDVGLQWQVDRDGELQVTSSIAGEKQNVVFYEKADGRQRAATPQAPLNWILGSAADANAPEVSAKAGDAQLQLLAGSMNNNPQLAKATVNLVWEAVYGRPLVGSVADPSAASESQALVELQHALAEQLRAHRFDIGQLFAWVIAAKPMQLTIPENWQSPKFESATAAELAAAAEQVRNFAGYPGAVPRRRFNELLARVNVKDSGLIDSLDAANNFPGGLLGQIQPKSESQTASKRVVRAEGPSIDQLLAASLESINAIDSVNAGDAASVLPAAWLSEVGGPNPFQRRVEHLYYLAGYWHPSPQQLEVARALREQSDSEAAALRKLWWVLANESL